MNFKKYNYPKLLPEVISFLVTNKCVCRCKHCFNWYETGQGGAIGNTKKKDLSADEIERIFKGLGSIECIYLGGGEPFIREDLLEILDITCKNCGPKTINISTNGQLTDNAIRTVERLLTQYSRLKLVVKISIDGIGKDHDEIRQREGAFEKAMVTYQRLKELKGRFKHLDIGINTVFSALNQDRIFDIYNYLAHLSPAPDCITQLLVRASPREPESIMHLDIERYRQWTDMYVQDMLKGEFEKDLVVKIATLLMYEYVYKTVKEKKRQICCYAGIAGAVIDNEGMVAPCEHKSPYGSLRQNDYNFKKIWYSDSAEKMRYDSYSQCFCTNEPQWWHPSVAYNKEVVEKGYILAKKLLLGKDSV